MEDKMNIDELFGKTLADFEDTPSKETSDKILADMLGHSFTESAGSSGMPRKFIYFGIAAAIILAAFVTFYFSQKNNIFVKNNATVSNKPTTNTINLKNETIKNNQQIIEQTAKPGNHTSTIRLQPEKTTTPTVTSPVINQPVVVTQNKQVNQEIKTDPLHKTILTNHTTPENINFSKKENAPEKTILTPETNTESPILSNEPSTVFITNNIITKEPVSLNSAENTTPADHTNSPTINQEVTTIENQVIQKNEEQPIVNPKVDEPVVVQNSPKTAPANNETVVKTTIAKDSLTTVRTPIIQQLPTINTSGLPGSENNKPWIVGVNYSPEMIFGMNDTKVATYNDRSRYGHDFNLSLKYSKDGIVISTGAGVGFYRKEIYSLLYYSNDYSANFKNTGISYDTLVNLQSHDTIINNSIVQINDASFSSNYLSNFSNVTTISKYIYLQIPVLVGYQHDMKKFYYSVNVGGIISVLLHKTELVSESDNIKIINLDKKTPFQVKTIWALEANAGLGYHLTDRISVAIDPTFRYYAGTLSKNSGLEIKHPYSLGIKTGFYVKL